MRDRLLTLLQDAATGRVGGARRYRAAAAGRVCCNTAMEGYQAGTYGDRIADAYDAMMATLPDPADCVDRLAELAGPGPALELGIGTGRVALPLAARGVEVHGIDASEAMVERMAAKPGGDAVTVTVGDFVLAGFVPDPTLYSGGQSLRTTQLGLDLVRLDAALHDPVAQRVDFQHVVVSGDGVRLYPGAIRYAWPSELDLMAKLAGLRLRERWGGWRREPFGAASTGHVSVYEHAGTAAS
jgi:SAM-dependent methyltransferase